MRLVVGLVALTLTASVALADDANPPEARPEPLRSRVGLRVVRVLPESQQALLYDRHRGTHVLVEAGAAINGYRVLEVGDDEVVLSAEGREVVLAAPDPTWHRGHEVKSPQVAKRDSAPADPYGAPTQLEGPLDPYGASAPGPTATLAPSMPGDPYASSPSDPYAAAETPADPYADTAPAPAIRSASVLPGSTRAVATTAAPKAARSDASANDFANVMTGSLATPDTAPPQPAPAAAIAISRKDVNAALSDFGRLTRSVRGTFTGAGARIDRVAPGSVFAKAGLVQGDVVTAVDGQPVLSIDDAADLYLRAPSMRTAKVDLVRGGAQMTIDVVIQ